MLACQKETLRLAQRFYSVPPSTHLWSESIFLWLKPDTGRKRGSRKIFFSQRKFPASSSWFRVRFFPGFYYYLVENALNLCKKKVAQGEEVRGQSCRTLAPV